MGATTLNAGRDARFPLNGDVQKDTCQHTPQERMRVADD